HVLSRRGAAWSQVRWHEAGAVLFAWIAIEPHRFDREVRGRGRRRSRAAHRRRACDRGGPAPVPRDVHNRCPPGDRAGLLPRAPDRERRGMEPDRKSTRLNSSHVSISYAVFCLKKKKKKKKNIVYSNKYIIAHMY